MTIRIKNQKEGTKIEGRNECMWIEKSNKIDIRKKQRDKKIKK